MAIPSAPASRQVASEAVKRLLGQTAYRHAVSIGPEDEVLRRAEMSAGRDPRIPGVREA